MTVQEALKILKRWKSDIYYSLEDTRRLMPNHLYKLAEAIDFLTNDHEDKCGDP